jgi:hypothetical protein
MKYNTAVVGRSCSGRTRALGGLAKRWDGMENTFHFVLRDRSEYSIGEEMIKLSRDSDMTHINRGPGGSEDQEQCAVDRSIHTERQ